MGGLGRATCAVRSISTKTSQEGIKCTQSWRVAEVHITVLSYILWVWATDRSDLRPHQTAPVAAIRIYFSGNLLWWKSAASQILPQGRQKVGKSENKYKRQICSGLEKWKETKPQDFKQVLGAATNLSFIWQRKTILSAKTFCCLNNLALLFETIACLWLLEINLG